MALFGKKQSDAFIGVDSGAGGIKLVELHKQKNRPVLWTYAIADEQLDVHAPMMKSPLEEEDDPTNGKQKKSMPDPLQDERVTHYAALLKELIKQAKVTTNRAVASLPVSQVFHAIITLPPVPEKELAHHVQAKAKKMLPHPIEEMQVVHQVIPKKAGDTSKDIRVLVTAAPKSLVTFFTAIFQKAGLQLEELETEAFALERSLVGRDKSTAMIIDIGSERTNFFIVDQGVPLTQRSIYMGGSVIDKKLGQLYGLDASKVGQWKVDLSKVAGKGVPMAPFQSMVDPILKEVQYSLDLFLHQSGNEGKRLEKIVLTGGSSVFPPIAAALQETFPVNVFVGNPWARVVHQQGLKPVLDSFGPRMGVAIGLALRNIE